MKSYIRGVCATLRTMILFVISGVALLLLAPAHPARGGCTPYVDCNCGYQNCGEGAQKGVNWCCNTYDDSGEAVYFCQPTNTHESCEQVSRSGECGNDYCRQEQLCDDSAHCCNKADADCCPNGRCGDNCCRTGTSCTYNESSPQCYSSEYVCGGYYCPSKRCGQDPWTLEPTCCPSDQLICDGKCCPRNQVCRDDICCPKYSTWDQCPATTGPEDCKRYVCIEGAEGLAPSPDGSEESEVSGSTDAAACIPGIDCNCGYIECGGGVLKGVNWCCSTTYGGEKVYYCQPVDTGQSCRQVSSSGKCGDEYCTVGQLCDGSGSCCDQADPNCCPNGICAEKTESSPEEPGEPEEAPAPPGDASRR